jgi:glyoxylase-like metal-dependent hydrolase (beta-lactamase superfamily II)
MIEIVPGVFTWPWYSERFRYHFHGTFVPHASGNVVVDPVAAPPDVLDELVRSGVASIALTNRNHFRAAAQVRAATGAQVLVHPADAAFVRGKDVTVDGDLVAGGTVGPFVVVDASGKSPGEVALHWPGRRILVVGDVCVGNPPGHVGLLSESVMDDPARLRASLRRLAELDFDALLVGDGEPILEGGRQALRTLLASLPR